MVRVLEEGGEDEKFAVEGGWVWLDSSAAMDLVGPRVVEKLRKGT